MRFWIGRDGKINHGVCRMTLDHSREYLVSLVHELRKLPKETGWVEFKRNMTDPEKIGEYLSALANSAALLGKTNAYRDEKSFGC